jgi:hypothetical protein
MLSSSGRQPRCPPRSRRAGLEEAPPAEALIRLLDAGWQVSARYPFLWHLPVVSPGKTSTGTARLLSGCIRSSGAGRKAAILTLPH